MSYRAGDPNAPKGHALLFFRDSDDPGAVWATYLIVAPIALDLGRYMPAAFAQSFGAQMPQAQGAMAYPLPPIPEKIEGGLARLERLAELRDDDLIDGGTVRASDPFQLMHPLTVIGKEYADRCEERVSAAVEALDAGLPESLASAPTDLDVDDILLQVMPDREKIGRLTRAVGTLRYAVEGGDERLVAEMVAEMQRVAQRLAEKYQATELIRAAQRKETRGGEIAQLYIERCYRLLDEEYDAIPEIERRIDALQLD